MSFLVANRIERIIQGERAIIAKMKLAEGRKEEDGMDEKGKEVQRKVETQDAGEGRRGETKGTEGALPTSSLATLLSTVFNPNLLE